MFGKSQKSRELAAAAALEKKKQEEKQMLERIHTHRVGVSISDIPISRLDDVISSLRAIPDCTGYQTDGKSTVTCSYETRNILTIVSDLFDVLVKTYDFSSDDIVIDCRSVGLMEYAQQQQNQQNAQSPQFRPR